jgi:sodium/potassium-transporting ATPase subunit alpha
MGAAVEATEEIRKWEEHMWNTEKLFQKFHTSKDNGLTAAKADELFKQLGENALTEKASTPWYVMLIKEFTGFFALLLWGGSILCFIGYGMDPTSNDNLFLGCILSFVVIVTGFFSYSQSSKAASLMADFKNFIPKEAMVLRDEKWGKLEAKYLVPGDIIKLNGGDNIPADCILFTANEMKVNNASLTGESEDILREVDMKASNIFESPNVAFFGTMCTAGTGTGMVFKTGDSTVIGRIAGLATSADASETTLSKDIETFIMYISGIAITLGVTFFVLGLIIGYPIITNVIFAIGIIVANVPEGLLATVTVSLALTAKRMAKKFVLVKNMEAVETLGSTSCICSDKTGTLTQNRMSVSQMFINGGVINCAVNFEIFKRLEEKEKAKDEPNMKNVPTPGYDVANQVFRTFIDTISLATISFFDYQPTSEAIRQIVAKKTGKSFKSLPADVSVDSNPALAELYLTAKNELIAAEEAKPFIKRNVEGDASETGLVKFVQPLLMDGPYGNYQVGGLDGLRKRYPMMISTGGDPCLIPFSSDIKFNLIIRDMNTEVKEA